MKVVSCNIGTVTEVAWRKKTVKTGIFKYPTDEPLFLGETDVQNDAVVDRKYHGGPDKACYLYSEDYYAYWKPIYPNLKWNYGMFGENLTVKNFDESKAFIGNIYRVGGALVQISEPRQPCFKLGVRFGNQNILKKFIASGYCGAYLRVLEKGKVQNGDDFLLVDEDKRQLPLRTVFRMMYSKKDFAEAELQVALNHPFLAESSKKHLRL